MTKPSRPTLSTVLEKIKRIIPSIKRIFSGSTKETAVVTGIDTTTSPADKYTTDDLVLGNFKKHVFIAPAFNNDKKLVPKLDYYIYETASTPKRPSTKDMPLVVMLHGCTQNANAFAEGTQMNRLAQQEGFVVLYPQQRISYNIGKCWRWYNLDESQGLAEAHTIMKLIQSTISMYELDPNKVFIAGMSAGAGMASLIAATYPNEIQAIGLHSGPALAIAKDMKSGVSLLKNGFDDSDQKSIANLEKFTQQKPHKTPTIIIQGVEDDVVHISNLEALTKQFLYLNSLEISAKGSVAQHLVGTDKEYSQTEYKHEQKTIVEVLKVKHLGHAWSGGDEQYPFHSEKGPQASRIFWDFFQKSMQ